MRTLRGVILEGEEVWIGHYVQVMRYKWVEAEGAEGPQPAKRACLPQGLEEGTHSAPQLLVYIYYWTWTWTWTWSFHFHVIYIRNYVSERAKGAKEFSTPIHFV